MDIGSTKESESLSILNESSSSNIKKGGYENEQKSEMDCDSNDLQNTSRFSDQRQLGSIQEDDLNDPDKINLVGGHINQIKIENAHTLLKKTSYYEVQQYQIIFNDSQEAQGLKIRKNLIKILEILSNAEIEQIFSNFSNFYNSYMTQNDDRFINDLIEQSQKQVNDMQEQLKRITINEGINNKQLKIGHKFSKKQILQTITERLKQLYSQNVELRTFIPQLIQIEERASQNQNVQEQIIKEKKTKDQSEKTKEQDVMLANINIESNEQSQIVSTNQQSINQIQNKKIDYFLKIENLTNGRENASIIDFKMGTNTITCNIKSEQRLIKRQIKDKNTTTRKLGFKIIGYVIKSRDKLVEEKFYKFPYKKENEIPIILKRIFSWPRYQECNCSLQPSTKNNIQIEQECQTCEDSQIGQIMENQEKKLGQPGSLNKKAQACILLELERLLDFLKNRNQRDIKGASILILVDHFSQSYGVKMIDLSTIKIYDDPFQKDDGLIKGVHNLIEFLRAL